MLQYDHKSNRQITRLVTTIHDAGKIAFGELNRKWMETDMGGGEELLKRTFHKWGGVPCWILLASS